MLPGLGISAGPSYDSNTYLENSSWFEANLQASWNVLRLLALPSLLNAREAQVTTDEARRLESNEREAAEADTYADDETFMLHAGHRRIA